MSTEKIANWFYNQGRVQAVSDMELSLEKRASSRGRSLAKLLGIGGGAALAPGMLNELGLAMGKGPLGGLTGIHQSAALRSLLAGDGGAALGNLRALPGSVGSDLFRSGKSLGSLGSDLGEALKNINIIDDTSALGGFIRGNRMIPDAVENFLLTRR